MNIYEAFLEIKKGKKMCPVDDTSLLLKKEKFAGEEMIISVKSGLPYYFKLQDFEKEWSVM